MTTPLFIGLDWFVARVKVEPRFVKRQPRRFALSPLCTNEQPPRENVWPGLIISNIYRTIRNLIFCDLELKLVHKHTHKHAFGVRSFLFVWHFILYSMLRVIRSKLRYGSLKTYVVLDCFNSIMGVPRWRGAACGSRVTWCCLRTTV